MLEQVSGAGFVSAFFQLHYRPGRIWKMKPMLRTWTLKLPKRFERLGSVSFFNFGIGPRCCLVHSLRFHEFFNVSESSWFGLRFSTMSAWARKTRGFGMDKCSMTLSEVACICWWAFDTQGTWRCTWMKVLLVGQNPCPIPYLVARTAINKRILMWKNGQNYFTSSDPHCDIILS